MTFYLSLTSRGSAVWVIPQSLHFPPSLPFPLVCWSQWRSYKGQFDFFKTTLHFFMVKGHRMLKLISLSRVAKCQYGTLRRSESGTQSTKHQLILSYETRPVMEFGGSLGGLWEQAGAEPFVLSADYQEAASRCSVPGETGSLCLGGMGQIHSPHFSH